MADENKKSITDQWKDKNKKAVEVTLPSGLKVKMRPPAWMATLKMGVLPSRLFNIAMGLEKAEIKKPDGTDNFHETVSIMHGYAIACCVEPRFVMENPKPDEVSVMDIADEDLIAIHQKGMELQMGGKEGEGTALDNFRPGPGGGSVGQGGEEVRPEAESAPGVK